jgi:DNA-binding transcriptional MerR regulator
MTVMDSGTDTETRDTREPRESGGTRTARTRRGAGEAAGPRPEGQDRYTIGEVAAITGLSAHTLRWYERIGLMPHVDRTHTGQRRFTNPDLDWLDLVGKLRLTGMSVAGMVRYAELVREGAETFGQRRALLETTREDVLRRIDELHDTLAVLNRKIDIYSQPARPHTTAKA